MTEKLIDTKRTRSNCTYHIAFATKYRKKVLNPRVVKRLHSMIKGSQKKLSFKIKTLEITDNSVYLEVQVNPELGPHALVVKLKTLTARALKKEFKHLTTQIPNLWTLKTLIVSVGSWDEKILNQYLEDQKNV